MAKKKQQTVYSFGSSYRCAREKREYTREQVAERVNISPRFLSAIENDRRKPSLNVLIRLVLAIGASFDEILAPSAVSDEEVTDRIKRLLHNVADETRSLSWVLSTRCWITKKKSSNTDGWKSNRVTAFSMNGCFPLILLYVCCRHRADAQKIPD